MFAVVIDSKVILFDYDSGEPAFVRALNVKDVTYVTFVEC
jgi:hypothetical protein